MADGTRGHDLADEGRLRLEEAHVQQREKADVVGRVRIREGKAFDRRLEAIMPEE